MYNVPVHPSYMRFRKNYFWKSKILQTLTKVDWKLKVSFRNVIEICIDLFALEADIWFTKEILMMSYILHGAHGTRNLKYQ
jgi:hypothetical protein